jgi:branched-chain amino acid transport system substrate-binding protein
MSISISHYLPRLAPATLCLLLAGCAGPQQQASNPNEIVIGVAGPMSGKYAWFGEQEKWGVQTAVADINAAGGLLGKQLHLELGDDRCDQLKAASVADQLVADHAALVVGHFCSSTSIKASGVYASQHIIQITPSSTNPALTDGGAQRGWKTLFRVANTDRMQGVFVGRWLAQTYPQGKIAILSDGTSYGQGLADDAEEQLKSTGPAPVLTRSYQSTSQDFADLVAAIGQSQADVVYIGGFHADVAQIVRQARAAGIKAEFAGGDALNNSEFATLAGSAGDGVRFSDVGLSTNRPEAANVVGEIRRQGYEPEGYTLASYAAVQAWAAGVTRAGTIDGDKVAAAMRSAPVPTVIGTLSWDAKGDIQQMLYAWYIWQDGRYRMDASN